MDAFKFFTRSSKAQEIPKAKRKGPPKNLGHKVFEWQLTGKSPTKLR
ncbi:unnamed protein product, partial [Heterosigma akashiwo]